MLLTSWSAAFLHSPKNYHNLTFPLKVDGASACSVLNADAPHEVTVRASLCTLANELQGNRVAAQILQMAEILEAVTQYPVRLLTSSTMPCCALVLWWRIRVYRA